MTPLVYTSRSEADTERLGAALAAALPDGTAVALCGTLGAGKTRLVQAVARASGVAEGEVVSPTFTLCHEYRGRRTIYHLDAYRLRDEDEFLQLGVEEYFDSPALTFVEWGDRVIDCLPRERVEIAIRVAGDTEREFVLRGPAKIMEAVASALTSSQPG
jgi:tRNA threonylcarbamoyladenosine biosynthesis protein TsaE